MNQDKTALLLDMGNSAAKWRFIQPDGLTEGVIDYHASQRTGLAETLGQPDVILLSKVTVKPEAEQLIRRVEQRFDLSVVEVKSPESGFGVTNGYQNPGQLGVDRWLAMVAAWNRFKSAMVVVDCGTAITIDLVDDHGHFHGGIIFPGEKVLAGVFESKVVHLDQPDVAEASFPPRNTADAIGLGVKWAAVAVVEKFLHNAGKLVGGQVKLIVTGVV